MAQTKTNKKKAVTKKADTKKADVKKKEALAIEKKARKALADAQKSVQAAKTAVQNAGKKLRNEADALANQTEKLAAKHAKAVGKRDAEAAKADGATRTSTTTDGPQSLDTEAVGSTASVPAPPVEAAASRPSSRRGPSLTELRERARAQKIKGYYRMNKAALIAALES